MRITKSSHELCASSGATRENRVKNSLILPLTNDFIDIFIQLDLLLLQTDRLAMEFRSSGVAELAHV